MLDFSWSHILIVLVVALAVVGPKDLPRLLRVVGQWVGKARAMAGQFRQTFSDLARESELDELRKEIKSMRGERLQSEPSGVGQPSPIGNTTGPGTGAPDNAGAGTRTARVESANSGREAPGEPRGAAGPKPSPR